MAFVTYNTTFNILRYLRFRAERLELGCITMICAWYTATDSSIHDIVCSISVHYTNIPTRLKGPAIAHVKNMLYHILLITNLFRSFFISSSG
jgi:hypothetical protein